MPVKVYLSYVKAVDVLEAREMLNELKISQFPHTNKAHQQKTVKALRKIAFPRSWLKQKAVSTKEAFAMLTGRGINRGK